MLEQLPTIALNVRLTPELSRLLDERCASLTAETGVQHPRSTVVRIAIAQYLGLVAPYKTVGRGQNAG